MPWATSVALSPGTPRLDTRTLKEGLLGHRLLKAGCLYLSGSGGGRVSYARIGSGSFIFQDPRFWYPLQADHLQPFEFNGHSFL